MVPAAIRGGSGRSAAPAACCRRGRARAFPRRARSRLAVVRGHDDHRTSRIPDAWRWSKRRWNWASAYAMSPSWRRLAKRARYSAAESTECAGRRAHPDEERPALDPVDRLDCVGDDELSGLGRRFWLGCCRPVQPTSPRGCAPRPTRRSHTLRPRLRESRRRVEKLEAAVVPHAVRRRVEAGEDRNVRRSVSGRPRSLG